MWTILCDEVKHMNARKAITLTPLQNKLEIAIPTTFIRSFFILGYIGELVLQKHTFTEAVWAPQT